MFYFSIETWLLIGLISILLYIYGARPYTYWSSRGIDAVRAYPFIGVMYRMFMKEWRERGFLDNIIEDGRKNKGKKYYGNFLGKNPELFVYDLELLKQILLADSSHFQNRMKFFTAKPLDKTVLVIDNDHWKHVRSYLSPTFSTVKLKTMTPIIQQCCHTIVEILNEKAADSEVKEKGIDIKDVVANFTMDITGRAFFSLDVDSQRNPENEYVQQCKKVMNPKFNFALFFAMLFPVVFNLLKKVGLEPSFMQKSTTAYFSSVIFQAFDERKSETTSSSKDFLQNMVKAEVSEDQIDKETNGHKWSSKGLLRDEILCNALIFILAGFNTTSDTLFSTLKNLAAHPEWQEKVYQEIMEVMTDEASDYENISKLVILDMVINESMRLYPAAPRIDRECTVSTVLDDILIEKGMIVVAPIGAIHMDEDHWPEPYKFDPERFSPENKPNIHPCAFMPFGAGPRNCVAMRLALVEVKLALAYILRNFKFSNAPDTPERIKFSMMGRPIPFNLKFEPRTVK